MRVIREPAGASLISVCGPTGVGKTTLLRRVQKNLIEQALPDLKKDEGANRQLLRILGMAEIVSKTGNDGTAFANQQKTATTNRKSNRVGERKPGRDPVGVKDHVG
jgi:molybdopterin-guanine dinucleotide biosynthesis protein